MKYKITILLPEKIFDHGVTTVSETIIDTIEVPEQELQAGIAKAHTVGSQYIINPDNEPLKKLGRTINNGYKIVWEAIGKPPEQPPKPSAELPF